MARPIMLNNTFASCGQFALGWLAVWSLALVGYLIRLKISDNRKRRIMAVKAERFGLIQEITATGTSLAKSSGKTAELHSVVTIVQRSDKRIKRWTRPAGFPTAGFQWN
jgi:hypothetical protein